MRLPFYVLIPLMTFIGCIDHNIPPVDDDTDTAPAIPCSGKQEDRYRQLGTTVADTLSKEGPNVTITKIEFKAETPKDSVAGVSCEDVATLPGLRRVKVWAGDRNIGATWYYYDKQDKARFILYKAVYEAYYELWKADPVNDAQGVPILNENTPRYYRLRLYYAR